MRISIQFEAGPMTPMEVPVLRAGPGKSSVSARPAPVQGGARLLKLRRRALRNWNRLFIPIELHQVQLANAI